MISLSSGTLWWNACKEYGYIPFLSPDKKQLCLDQKFTAVTWPAVAVHAQMLTWVTNLERCWPNQTTAEKIDKLPKSIPNVQWHMRPSHIRSVCIQKITATPTNIEGFSIVLNISDNSALYWFQTGCFVKKCPNRQKLDHLYQWR
jgi:hypothetical protein